MLLECIARGFVPVYFAGRRYNRACDAYRIYASCASTGANYINYIIHFRPYGVAKIQVLSSFFINFNKKESFCPFFLTVPTSCILYFTFQSLFSFSKSLGFNYILGFNFIRVYHFIICSNFITRLYLSQEITYIYGCWYL